MTDEERTELRNRALGAALRYAIASAPMGCTLEVTSAGEAWYRDDAAGLRATNHASDVLWRLLTEPR